MCGFGFSCALCRAKTRVKKKEPTRERRQRPVAHTPARNFLVQTKREGLVAIVEQKLVFSISGQRFPQLLQSPLRRRRFRGIEMNQPSRTDLQRHKYINHAKANGHCGEEITSYDCVGMILHEGGPALVS